MNTSCVSNEALGLNWTKGLSMIVRPSLKQLSEVLSPLNIKIHLNGVVKITFHIKLRIA